jgi:glyoxylase-like metal-dependent hydrolase (beta-lactamase superfamily II)
MNEMPATSSGGVRLFETNGGGRIYQIPLQEFPILWGYAYLVLLEDTPDGDYRVLIDTGSGFGDSNQHLEQGFQEISKSTGQDISLGDLTHVFITHGHIDHFGGLSFVRPRTAAKIGVHELDLQTLTNYEERLAVVSRRLEGFLAEAGVPAERRNDLIEMYQFPKRNYRSVQIDFTFEAAGMRVGPFEFLHVPGHCAGHVAIRLQDVLFAGDHVLNELSPHQSPESLTLFTGLGHYLRSLDDLEKWAGAVPLTLGGHRNPITDLPARCASLRKVHYQRLQKILELIQEPHTIAEISQALFGEVHGYNVLLALEETGAHIEYLAQRGQLRISNLEEVEAYREPVAIYYQRLTPTRDHAASGSLGTT